MWVMTTVFTSCNVFEHDNYVIHWEQYLQFPCFDWMQSNSDVLEHDKLCNALRKLFTMSNCCDWMQSDVLSTFRYMYKITRTFLNMINFVLHWEQWMYKINEYYFCKYFSVWSCEIVRELFVADVKSLFLARQFLTLNRWVHFLDISIA